MQPYSQLINCLLQNVRITRLVGSVTLFVRQHSLPHHFHNIALIRLQHKLYPGRRRRPEHKLKLPFHCCNDPRNKDVEREEQESGKTGGKGPIRRGKCERGGRKRGDTGKRKKKCVKMAPHFFPLLLLLVPLIPPIPTSSSSRSMTY